MQAFEPTRLSERMLRNRIAMAPMTTYSAESDLTPSKEELDYYAKRSTGAGMVISAAIAVNRQAQAFPRQISLKDDAYIAPMRKLVDRIKEKGAKAIAQLHHGGRMNDPSLFENPEDIVSASAVRAERENAVTPKAMDEADIERTVDDFQKAARRAIEAGFEGVELHGANTYLLQQFFSPHSNRRDDAYGGSLERRLTFIDRVIDRVEKTVSSLDSGAIIGYRFSPEEIETPGITLNDTVQLLRHLKQKPLDYLHVSLGHYDQTSLRDKTTKIARVILSEKGDIPMMASGSIDSFEALEAAQSLGYDFFAMGKALLADPDAVEHIRRRHPIDKRFDSGTLPPRLYERLKRKQKVFLSHGYRF